MGRTLTRLEAKQFYDRFGARQDKQTFYESRAMLELLLRGGFEQAHAVVEFGCGTGAFADRLLKTALPADCRYLALDISTTMVELARKRLARWGSRVEVRQSSGEMRVDAPDGSFDRFVSTYVLDLLSEADIRQLLQEAHRLLVPGGLLCLVSLTRGATTPAKVVTALWQAVHSLRARWVGGCRPLELSRFLDTMQWRAAYRTVITQAILSSEVVVVARE